MTRKIWNGVLLCVLLLVSCSQEEIPVNQMMQFAVSEFPAFDDADSRTVGTPDLGKTNWQKGDQLLVSLTSQKYGTNTAVLNYDGVTWTSDLNLPYLESESPAIKVVYAPAYQWTNGSLTLKENMMAGMDEYIEALCNINNNTISISFSGVRRNYSRLRIVTMPNMEFSFNVNDFIPSGQLGKVNVTYNLRADANGNAFLYGTFGQGASVSFLTNYVITWAEHNFSTPTLAGKSYVLDATDNPKKHPYRKGDIVTLLKNPNGNCSGCGKPSDESPTGTIESVEKMENGTVTYWVKLDHCGSTIRLQEAAISGKKHLYSIGDVVNCKNWTIEYCPNCAKLIMYYQATITGFRGIDALDGKDVYWIIRSCCGHKTSITEFSIIGLVDE